MKNLGCFFSAVLFLLATSSSFAQSTMGANAAARSEQGNNGMMGTASAGAGGAVMAGFCGCATSPTSGCGTAALPAGGGAAAGAAASSSSGSAKGCGFGYCQAMCFVIGPGLIAAGIADMAIGQGRNGAIDATNGSNFDGTGGGAGGLGGGSGSGTAGNSPVYNSDLQHAIDVAKSYGVDPTNPESMAAAKANAGPMDANGNPMGLDSATPEQLAQTEKIMKDVADKYHVPNLLNFTGGGGGHRGRRGDKLDLAALMGLGKDKDRGPASVEGLSKNFNGDSIGVAGDDIFKQITRRYQSKIRENSFLAVSNPSPMTKTAPLKK